MSDASPQRVKTLLSLLPRDNSVIPYNSVSDIQIWKKTLTQSYWLKGKAEEKNFPLIKRAAKESNTLVLVPDAMAITPSELNVVFHYLYKKKVVSIGYFISFTTLSMSSLVAFIPSSGFSPSNSIPIYPWYPDSFTIRSIRG